MRFSAHRAHANRAFIFGHLHELKCFSHSSQILSGSSTNSSSGSYLPVSFQEYSYYLFDPHLLSRRLALDLFKILLRIRIHQNRFQVYNGGDGSGIDVLGGHSNIMGMGLEEEILMLPMITICLISFGASFRLYLKLCPNFAWNLIGSSISLGSRDKILEGRILLHPVTLL